MLDIENLRKLAKDDNKVFIAQHAMQRFRERGIKYSDVINCIIVGEIIEQYPNDYPTPSCLILGINMQIAWAFIIFSYTNKYFEHNLCSYRWGQRVADRGYLIRV